MIHDTSGSHGPPRTAPQVLTRQQVRQVDRVAIEEFGMSGLVLMENAGRQVADKLVELEQADPYLIVCGKGNNGGDGFVAARHLELRGYTVHVAIWAEPGEITGDAAANLAILQHAGSQLHWCTVESLSDFGRLLDGAATVVDCLLGTGASGPPRPPLDRVIEQLAGRAVPIVAVDLPSGLDCDTGHAPGAAVRAAHTLTFVAIKQGFLVPGARAYTGEVHVLDIGAPQQVVDRVLSGS